MMIIITRYSFYGVLYGIYGISYTYYVYRLFESIRKIDAELKWATEAVRENKIQKWTIYDLLTGSSTG